MANKLIKRLVLSTVFSLAAQIGAAQSLEGQIVELAAGKWLNQQETYMAGKKVPQGSFSHQECLPEAETALPVSHYIQKFLNGVGPDLACTITNLSGASGNISADISCVGDHGSSSDMTLNYKYGLKKVDISGQGESTYAGQKVPFRIAASSKYVGECQ